MNSLAVCVFQEVDTAPISKWILNRGMACESGELHAHQNPVKSILIPEKLLYSV